jgi:TRAP-type transport system small permease protein
MLTLVSSLALGVLLLVTFAGVVMRYFFNAPILGNNEIIELASVVLVMLAMPGAARQEMHIRVDVFDRLIGAFGRLAGDILARGVSIYLLLLLGWRAWGKLADAAKYGDATNMLSLPLWPFYGLLVLGASLYALVLFIQLVDIIRSGVARND